jgi:hypothetical protein
MKKAVQVETISQLKSRKMEKLFLGLIYDGLGMLSFTVPFVGEFSDVIWAPIAGFLLARMYKGTIGKVGGVIAFTEEFLPFSDFIPTFTLTWIYTYLIKKEQG